MAEDFTIENQLESIAGQLEVKAGISTPVQQKDVTVESKLRRISDSLSAFVGSIETHTLAEHTDVDAATVPTTAAHVLRADGTEWVNSFLTLSDLSDVASLSPPFTPLNFPEVPATVLRWNAATSLWNDDAIGITELKDFQTRPTGATGTTEVWGPITALGVTPVVWTGKHIPNALFTLSDTDIPALPFKPADNDILQYNLSTSKWKNETTAAIAATLDHGLLAGLADDDHTQYILVAGTRAFTGSQAMGDNSLTGIDTLTFTDTAGTIAGIQNQNLVDKSASETIASAWLFSPGLVSAGSLIMSGADIIMGDNDVTGINTLSFTDTAGTIAGIQNQNLVDKSAAETIAGAWIHNGGITMGANIVMADNSVTGLDTLIFTDVNGTIAGIENQNLLDKSAAESIAGAYTFTGAGDAIIVTNDIDLNGKLHLGASPAVATWNLNVDDDGSTRSARFDGCIGIRSSPLTDFGIYAPNAGRNEFGNTGFGVFPSTTIPLRTRETYTGAQGSTRQVCLIEAFDDRATGNGEIQALRVDCDVDDPNYISGDITHIGARLNVLRTGTTTTYDECNLYAFFFTVGQASGNTGPLDDIFAVFGDANIRGDVVQYTAFKANANLIGGTLTTFTGLDIPAPIVTSGAVTNADGVKIGDLSVAGTLCNSISIAAAATTSATKQNINMAGGDWNTGHLQMENGHAWYDRTNDRFRVSKDLDGSAPTAAIDGTPIPLSYGHMYTNSDIAISGSTVNTWYKVDAAAAWTTGVLNLVTFTDPFLQATEAGTYLITWSLGVFTANAADEIEGGIMIDPGGGGSPVVISEGQSMTTTHAASVEAGMAGSAVVVLTAADEVHVGINNNTSSVAVTVGHGNLTLTRIQ